MEDKFILAELVNLQPTVKYFMNWYIDESMNVISDSNEKLTTLLGIIDSVHACNFAGKNKNMVSWGT